MATRYGARLTVEASTMKNMTCVQALDSGRLTSITFTLPGKSNAATAVLACAPPDTSMSREGRYMSWTEVGSNVKVIPREHHWVMAMDFMNTKDRT